MNPIEATQTIAQAIQKTGKVIHGVVSAVNHPVVTLQHAGLWGVMHGEIFAVVGIIGVLLWLFGLHAGKRIIQWTLAVFTLFAILSGSL